MKTKYKVLIGIGIASVCFGILLIVGCAYLMFGSNVKTTDDISYYRALSGETEGSDMIPILFEEYDMPCPYDLPKLNELDPASDYRFHYMAKRESFFQSHAYILIVSYDEEEYATQKQLLNENYVYRTDLIEGEDTGIEPKFRLDGFAFHAADADAEYSEGYPKAMLFIGTSDAENEIAYIYFYDQDLDYVSPSLPEFILRETGWREVK